MKNLVLRLVMIAAAWGLAGAGLAQEAGTGTVAGVVEVQKARVKTRGAKSFKDVVVYLAPTAPAVYPPPAGHAVMDQRGLVFIPHVMAVQQGTTVDFLNSDNDRHNVYFLYDETGADTGHRHLGAGREGQPHLQRTRAGHRPVPAAPGDGGPHPGAGNPVFQRGRNRR